MDAPGKSPGWLYRHRGSADNMNINIIEAPIPTLAPLAQDGKCGDLKFGGMSWRKLLRQRWIEALGRTSVLTLNTTLAFWPSTSLLEKLHECPQGFRVVDAEGNVLAQGVHTPAPNAMGITMCGWGGDGAAATANCDGEAAAEVPMDGESLLVRYPWDLLTIQEQVLRDAPHGRINGIIHEGSVIDGNLDLGDGSIILPGVYILGNVVIGEGCTIGPNCCIRGCTAIGDGCRIGQGAEIKNSILMDHVLVSHVAYVGDTIIAPGVDLGAGTMVGNVRSDGAHVTSAMEDGKMVDTGRSHFGAVIGQGVRTGVNTSICPGCKLSAGCCTEPGEVVKQDC